MEAIETYATVRLWVDYLIPLTITIAPVAVMSIWAAVSSIKTRIRKKRERLEALNIKED